MDKATLEALYAPFELKERVGGGGMTFKYIKSNDIIDRMNKTFGGNWRTDVQDQEVIEDSVIIRVHVEVKEGSDWFGHDGYGASSHKRFTGGFKKGQIVDVGNAYKSALSMAIKNAAAKFGCGLYLEGDAEDSDTPSAPGPDIPLIPSDIPPVPEFPKVDLPTKNQGPELPKVDLPPIPEPVVDKPSPELPPIPPSMGAQSGPTPEVLLPDNGSPELPPQIGEDKLTAVQSAALEALLGSKGLNYMELVKESFEAEGMPTDELPEMKSLTQAEATIAIKFGNDKTRR